MIILFWYTVLLLLSLFLMGRALTVDFGHYSRWDGATFFILGAFSFILPPVGIIGGGVRYIIHLLDSSNITFRNKFLDKFWGGEE